MSKFFGRLFDKKIKLTQYTPYVPPPMTDGELALAALVFCATAHRSLPAKISDTIDALVQEDYDSPYREMIILWQNRDSKWADNLDEMEVLFSVILERTIKLKRQANADFVPTTSPEDIYDRISY